MEEGFTVEEHKHTHSHTHTHTHTHHTYTLRILTDESFEKNFAKNTSYSEKIKL